MLSYSHYMQYNANIKTIKIVAEIIVANQLALIMEDYCGLSR